MENVFEMLIKNALAENATDLHFQSKFNPLIYIRKQGKLFPFKKMSLEVYQKLMLYLAYRANINLNHHLKPQTGSFQCQLNKDVFYLRLSYIPSRDDMHLVLRILNHHEPILFSHLTPQVQLNQQLISLLNKEQGLIVVCGPTGSGKSTTLHAFMEEIKQSYQKSLMSIEDPIEIIHDGIVQIEIDEQKEKDFPTILNQILRHDPDVVMIGEIRDEKSAAMAMRLALTGHLILTTLHSYSAQGALIRLLNLGLLKDDLKEVLKGIVFQRLVYLKKNNQAFCCFEIASGEALKILLNNGKRVYPTLRENALQAVKDGYLTDEDIQTFIDD